MTRELASWLQARLVCPRDQRPLVADSAGLRCSAEHFFRFSHDIPVLLLTDEESTHPELKPTGERKRAEGEWGEEPLTANDVDSYVQEKVTGTCGNLYQPLVRKLPRYPIPDLRVVPQDGREKAFLDIGCNWGRWSVAASRLGYDVVGIDPMLDALSAARRVAEQLGSQAEFISADARWLPFADSSFDVVFSYSVFQHFRKDDVRTALDEISRVLVPGGLSVIEMPTAAGLRNLYVRARRKLVAEHLAPLDFHVRYWPLRELVETFTSRVGPTHVEVDSFFFINGQPADRDLFPKRYKAALTASELLRKAATRVPSLAWIADSVYLASRKVAT